MFYVDDDFTMFESTTMLCVDKSQRSKEHFNGMLRLRAITSRRSPRDDDLQRKQ